MKGPFESEKLNKWIEGCPTSCNIEYNEDYGRLCIFLREEDEDEEEFSSGFAV